MQSANTHIPVFLNEAVAALNIQTDGVYLDGTLGRAGHSQKIARQLSQNGRLIAIDRDLDAIAAGEEMFSEDVRVLLLHGDFSRLEEVLNAEVQSLKFDGILLDIGVSSPQLDQAERGFSFMHDGALDMRMDVTKGQTAAEWLAIAEEKEIADVIYQFGEEKFSRRIARAIIARRIEEPIKTTLQLAELVSEAVPRHEKHKHPATRTFQAIRIYINDELGQLISVLPQAVRLLNKGGRLVVISFHSLEDRIVKRFMRDLTKGEIVPKHIPIVPEYHAPIKTIGKAIKPSDEELKRNPRARSAVLRVAERTEVAYA